MEAPTPPSRLRRWSPVWTSLAAVGLFVVALVAITSVALDDQVFYFARDLSAAIPALLLVAAALWLWPRPRSRLGRLARTVVLVGLALFGLGDALEAIGIWGWSWNGAGRYVVTDQGLAQTHDLGRLGGVLGELALVVGVLLAMASAVPRRGRIDHGWRPVASA
jgi:apolipoprotein N-acyltransferase